MPPEPPPKTTSTTGPPSWMSPVTPVVPDHELIRRIGGGSYGDVWLARTTVGTWRAVKVVFRDRFTDARPYEREFHGIQKFEPLSRGNEAFIDILQIGRNDAEGYFYYVMELADDANAELGTRNVELPLTRPADTLSPTGGEGRGEGAATPQLTSHSVLSDPHSYIPKTLSKVLLQRGRLPLGECLELGLTLNLGLAHLHKAGLIHRDIKPSNIIFVGGVPKLADIGLVIELAEARSFVGTEGFIPPEGPNSPQADLYSLGKVLYEAGMGKDRKDFPEPYTRIAEAPDAAALLEFNAILLKACAANREERYQSAEEMNADLALLQSGGSVRRQRKLAGQLRFVQRAGAAVTALAAIVALGWWWQAKQTHVVRELVAEKSQLAEEKTQLAEENRHRIVRLDVANGVRLLDEGDPAGGLLWFAEALALVTNKPAEESIHRIRIQQTLNQMPRPAQVLAHEHPVTSMAFSPDGKRIATHTQEGRIQLWDVQTGTPLWHPLQMEGDEDHQVGFSRDGEHLLVSSSRVNEDSNPTAIFTNSVAVIDATSGVRRFARVATDLVRATFTSDGRWLVAAEPDHVIRVLDVRDGSQVAALKGHTNSILALACSNSGDLLASTSVDGTIRLWRLPSGEPVGLPFPFHPPQHLPVLSPDGKRLATCESIVRDGITNDFVRVWNTETLTPIGKPIGVVGDSGTIWFDSPTSRLLFVGFGNNLRVFDVDSLAEPVKPIVFDKPMGYWGATPDARRVVVGGREGVSGIWSLETGEGLAPPFRHGRQIRDIAISPDGSELATPTDEGACVLWKVNRHPEDAMHEFNANIPKGPPQTLLHRFSPDRRRFLIILSDGTVRLVDTEHMVEMDLPGPKPTHCSPHQCLFAPGNHQWAIAYAPTNKTASPFVELWREEAGNLQSHLLPLPDAVSDMTFDSAGATLITVCGRELQTWRTADGTLERSVTIPETFWTGELFPDGRTALAVDRGINRFVLYDVVTGGIIPTPIEAAIIMAFAFDSTGERFVTVTENQWARVWSTKTGAPLSPAVRHDGALTWVDWSPDGKRIAMAGVTPEARVWDASTGDFSIPPLRIGDKPLETVMWSLDGRFIVARSDEKSVRVWDAATGEAVTPLLKHNGYVRLANLVANNRLITLSLPNVMRAWDLAESKLPADVLADYAKLVSGRRLNAAGVMLPLKPTELAELNRSLRARAPQLFE